MEEFFRELNRSITFSQYGALAVLVAVIVAVYMIVKTLEG